MIHTNIFLKKELNIYNTHLHRIVFVENWRSRASKMINLINLDQQRLSDIYIRKIKS